MDYNLDLIFGLNIGLSMSSNSEKEVLDGSKPTVCVYGGTLE